MLETLEAWSGFILVLIFFSIILATLFIWVGIKATGIEDISLKKIILTALAVSLVTYFTIVILSTLPVLRAVPSFVIGLLLSLFIIKSILGFTFQQNFIVWGFNVIAQVLAVIICAKLFIGGIKDLIKII